MSISSIDETGAFFRQRYSESGRSEFGAPFQYIIFRITRGHVQGNVTDCQCSSPLSSVQIGCLGDDNVSDKYTPERWTRFDVTSLSHGGVKTDRVSHYRSQD